MAVPQWRSLLCRHTYLGVLLPCHYRCAYVHTLRPLFHMTVMTILYQAMMHMIRPSSRSLTALIGLIAVTTAQVSKPLYNACFEAYTFDRSLTEEERKKKREKELAQEEEQRQELRANRRASFYQSQTKKMQEKFASAVTHSSEKANALRRKTSVRFREEYEVLREEELEAERRAKAEEDAEAERKRKLQEQMYSVLEEELDIDFPPDEEVQAAIVRKAKAASGRYVAFKLDTEVVAAASPGKGSSPPRSLDLYQHYLDDIELGDDLVDISFPGEQPQYRSASLAFAGGSSEDDNPSSLSPRKIFVHPKNGRDADSSEEWSAGDTLKTTIDDNVVDISFPGEDAQLRSIAFDRPVSSESGSLSLGGLGNNTGTTTSDELHHEGEKGVVLSPSSSSSRFAVKDVPAVFLRPSSSFKDIGASRRHSEEDVMRVLEQPPSSPAAPRALDIDAEMAVSEVGDESATRSDGGTVTGSGNASSFRRTSSSLISSVKVKKEPIITYQKTSLAVFGSATLVLIILSSTIFAREVCFANHYSDGWSIMVLVDILFCDTVMLALSFVHRVLVVDESKGQKPYSELHPVDGIVRYVVHERDM